MTGQTSAGRSCFPVNRPNVSDLRARYELFKKFQSSSTQGKDPTGYLTGGHCNFTYIPNKDHARLPHELPEAICNNCSALLCSPRYYWHKVLKKECDQNTGRHVLVWKAVRLAVAFVYNPTSR